MLESEFIAAQDKGSRRLMIMLHGLGDSRAGYRWLPEALALPWLNYLLVDAPDAYYGGYSWFDFTGDIVPGVSRSRKLLLQVLEAQRQEGFASEETVLGGFSQGCLMAIEVALRYPRRFAGVVGISGYVCEPQKLIAELSPVALRQRLLITHGTEDPMIPLPAVRAQIKLLQSAGVQIEWHEFAKAHTIAGEEELAVIRNFICAGYESRSPARAAIRLGPPG
ncbi:Phospholipase/Carboxylesterase [Verrucomicrobia bacterium]|nr:Phospholipase/Carboxylesterase [Verrucomicrobiota bacterium]